MRVSSKEYYGLAALSELVQAGKQRPLAVAEIAQARGISPKFLEQAMCGLRRAGLVRSTRGTHGGYELVVDPNDITMADLVHALEGGIERSERAEAGLEIPNDRIWSAFQQRVCHALDTITLADLAGDASQGGGGTRPADSDD